MVLLECCGACRGRFLLEYSPACKVQVLLPNLQTRGVLEEFFNLSIGCEDFDVNLVFAADAAIFTGEIFGLSKIANWIARLHSGARHNDRIKTGRRYRVPFQYFISRVIFNTCPKAGGNRTMTPQAATQHCALGHPMQLAIQRQVDDFRRIKLDDAVHDQLQSSLPGACRLAICRAGRIIVQRQLIHDGGFDLTLPVIGSCSLRHIVSEPDALRD